MRIVAKNVLGKYFWSSQISIVVLLYTLHSLLNFLRVYFRYKFIVESVGIHYGATLHTVTHSIVAKANQQYCMLRDVFR